MTASSFKAFFLAGLLLLPHAVKAEQKLSVPTNSEVRGTIDHASRHYRTERTYYIEGLSPLDYRAYSERMAQMLQWVGEEEKKLHDRYFVDLERHKTLARYMDEEDARIKEKEARYFALSEGKGRNGSLEKQAIAEALLDLSRRFASHMNELSTLAPKVTEYTTQQAELSRLKAALEPLARPNLAEGARPTVEYVALTLGSQRLLESQLKLNPEAIAAMRESIANYQQLIANIQPELVELRSLKEELDTQYLALSQAGDVAQQNFKLKLQEMDRHIESELGRRFLGNYALDVLEVVTDSKGSPWVALAGVANKAMEAYVFNDGGKKNWQMYDPNLLFGEYRRLDESMQERWREGLSEQEKAKLVHAHWTDGAKTASPYLGQAARSFMSLPGDALANIGKLEIQRSKIAEMYGKQLRDALASKASALSKAQMMDMISNVQMDQLVKHELRWFSDTAATAAEKESLQQARHTLGEAMVKLAEKMRANNAIIREASTAITAAERRLAQFTVFSFFPRNAGKAVKPKPLVRGVGEGILWDTVRQGWQSLMDRDSERVWMDFLDTEIKVKAILRNLERVNQARFSVNNSLALYEHLSQLYQMMSDETERTIQEYSAATMGQDGLHVLTRSVTSDETMRPVLKITTRGEMQGMAVYLKGDKGDIEFTPIQPFNTYKSLTLPTVHHEIEGVDETKEWELRLGRQPEVVKRKLSEISSDGKLLIAIRFY